MPKYFQYKVAGYFLYFTSHCIVEPIHAHASDSKLSEGGSAKLWLKDNGDTVIASHGTITHKEWWSDFAIGNQSATVADKMPIENANRMQRVVDYMASHDNLKIQKKL